MSELFNPLDGNAVLVSDIIPTGSEIYAVRNKFITFCE